MRASRFLFVLSLLLPLFSTAYAQTIALPQRGATVWGVKQTIRGTLDGATTGTLYLNDAPIPFTTTGSAFAVNVTLGEGVNTLVACAGAVCSDTLRYTLGFQLRPELLLTSAVTARTVTLTGRVLDNPGGAPLTFSWQQDDTNPGTLPLTPLTDTTAQVTIPAGAAPGEYYFTLTATSANDREGLARTFVTVNEDGVTPFDIADDHAAWIDRAVLYEITPRFFTNQFNGKLAHITQKIPEFVRLGVNTIWLQPIFPTAQGQQAYDVTDYFGVWSALGNKDDLRTLVEAAHEAGLRVILDFVPNHTSIEHPYAQQAIAAGADSYYYNFYQRNKDTAPYSSNYRVVQQGKMTFIVYFWNELVNLNYNNPDVQRFMIEATRYWVEEFGIDGFRFDAVWGVVARNPGFVQEWRQALKRVRPDLLLLGETKATDPVNFDGRFDAAYDWNADPNYISRWAWQRGSMESTVFNTGLDRFRARDLRSALTNSGAGYASNAIILRYLENNDTPRFTANHSDAQTRMAAALMFGLPGIPMLYYGQEVGIKNMYPSFPVSLPISTYDRAGFFGYYQHLTWLREHFPALTSLHFEEVPVTPAGEAGQTFAFRRWQGDQNVVGVVNLGSTAVSAQLALPAESLGLDPNDDLVLTDLFSGEPRQVTAHELAALSVDVPPHTTQLFVLADSAVFIRTDAAAPEVVPATGELAQNYPNPFSGQTTITFTLAQPGRVSLRVYDVLGRLVAELADGVETAGTHTVTFDAGRLSSGTYVYRLEAGGRAHTRLMSVVK